MVASSDIGTGQENFFKMTNCELVFLLWIQLLSVTFGLNLDRLRWLLRLWAHWWAWLNWVYIKQKKGEVRRPKLRISSQLKTLPNKTYLAGLQHFIYKKRSLYIRACKDKKRDHKIKKKQINSPKYNVIICHAFCICIC